MAPATKVVRWSPFLPPERLALSVQAAELTAISPRFDLESIKITNISSFSGRA